MKLRVTIPFLLIALIRLSSAAFAAESTAQRSEWEKTVEAAKKEGQLTLYHWGTPLMLDAGMFQKAYPEIKVTTVSAMGTELMQRILAERRGEKFIPDVYIAGIATMVVLHKEAEAKGLPVVQLRQAMKEGVGLSSRVGHMALLNRAPHPNAAKVFINWYLSREGQELFQKLQITAHDPADSLRIDIGKNQIPPADRRQDGVKYIDLDEQKIFDPTPAIQLIKEILGEAGK